MICWQISLGNIEAAREMQQSMRERVNLNIPLILIRPYILLSFQILIIR